MSSEPFADQFLKEGLNTHSNVSRRCVRWIVCGILLVISMRGQFSRHTLVMIVKMSKLFKATACEGDKVEW